MDTIIKAFDCGCAAFQSPDKAYGLNRCDLHLSMPITFHLRRYHTGRLDVEIYPSLYDTYKTEYVPELPPDRLYVFNGQVQSAIYSELPPLN